MLSIEYRESDRRALIAWDKADEQAPWLSIVRRLVFDHTDDTTQEDAYRISLPWWNFLALRAELLKILNSYGLKPGESLSISSKAIELLKQSRRVADGYVIAKEAAIVAPEGLLSRLKSLGFKRELSAEQIRNVCKMAALPAAATFSVPGAGKTTEALAYFFDRAQADERLLVIAPKNAFAAWDEQIKDCMPGLDAEFVRLRGGRENIARLLSADPRFMLITYQQLTRVPDLIAAHCAGHPVDVFLDESHRIKSGVQKQTARATLGLAHLPVRKLIMSGTPMPQALEDLIGFSTIVLHWRVFGRSYKIRI